MDAQWKERLNIIEDSLKSFFAKRNERWGEAGFMRLLGVNKGRWTQIFKRKGMLYLDEAGKICNLLQINPEWLLGISQELYQNESSSVKETQTPFNTQNTEVGELVLKMVDIMKSESNYRGALAEDIRLYHKKLEIMQQERLHEKCDLQSNFFQSSPPKSKHAVNNEKNLLTPS